jgi:2-haloacid dehalogenase
MQTYKFLSFDCYGTLIDWEKGILDFFNSYPINSSISPLEILRDYATFEAAAEHGSYKSYREILRLVFLAFADKFSFNVSPDEEYLLSESVKNWPAFSDSEEALKILQKQYSLVIISNIDDDLFAHSENKLGVKFDHVFTAQQIGSYKPSLNNFNYVQSALELDRKEWLHVAQSLYHDHQPTKLLNIDSVWIKRPSLAGSQGVAPVVDVSPDRVYTSMIDFANDQCKL